MQPSIPWSSVFVFVTERQPCILWILLCRFHSSHHLLSLAVTHCHLFPLVVTHCTTNCHSLYHSLSSIVTHVIRCTTRLSFYKRSFGGCSHLKKLFSFWAIWIYKMTSSNYNFSCLKILTIQINNCFLKLYFGPLVKPMWSALKNNYLMILINLIKLFGSQQ